MIILSQDKKEIINFDNVNLIRAQDDGTIVVYDNTYNEQIGVSSVLGQYETEKAKKMLQEIYYRYSQEKMYKEADSKIPIEMIPIYAKSEDAPFVFKMPEE